MGHALEAELAAHMVAEAVLVFGIVAARVIKVAMDQAELSA